MAKQDLLNGETLGQHRSKVNANFTEVYQGIQDLQTDVDNAIPSAEKGVTVATLVNGTVPSSQLPSYVDDVLEFANLAAFPATGETGKIYIALNTNYEYRWSGSTYVQLVASPGSTDAVPEGTTNKYFTEARVRSTPATGYDNSTTGAISATDQLIVVLSKIGNFINTIASYVIASVLTGYTLGSNAAIAATDTVLQAFGKLQAQLNAKQNLLTAGSGITILNNIISSFTQSKSTNIASAATTDLSTATGTLVHITGTANITSFGTVAAGMRFDLVFDGAVSITASANIILPSNRDIIVAAGDSAVLISEGGGVWRLKDYQRASEAYSTYVPTWTGFSTAPVIEMARYKMIDPMTCEVAISITTAGTSNSTTTEVTLPFVAGPQTKTYIVLGTDGGTQKTIQAQTIPNTNRMRFVNLNFAALAASGQKFVAFSVSYEIA